MVPLVLHLDFPTLLMQTGDIHTGAAVDIEETVVGLIQEEEADNMADGVDTGLTKAVECLEEGFEAIISSSSSSLAAATEESLLLLNLAKKDFIMLNGNEKKPTCIQRNTQLPKAVQCIIHICSKDMETIQCLMAVSMLLKHKRCISCSSNSSTNSGRQ